MYRIHSPPRRLDGAWKKIFPKKLLKKGMVGIKRLMLYKQSLCLCVLEKLLKRGSVDIKYILAIMTQALPAYLVMFLVALNLMKVIKIRIGFFKSFLAFLLGFLASTCLLYTSPSPRD